MKKVLLLTVMSVVFFSCVTLPKYQVNSYHIDYSRFTEKGFFISESNSVSFNYEPVSSITVESVSGHEVSETYFTSEMASNGVVKAVEKQKTGKYKLCNLNDAFDKLYEDAVLKGASGVINIKYNFVPSYTIGNTRFESKWVVTGMFIKKY